MEGSRCGSAGVPVYPEPRGAGILRLEQSAVAEVVRGLTLQNQNVFLDGAPRYFILYFFNRARKMPG